MLITKEHMLNHRLTTDDIRFMQEYSCHELPFDKTYGELVQNTKFPIDSKDICDLSIKRFCINRGEFYSHFEIYYAIQTALNMLRILEGKQIISLVFLCKDRRTQTAIYKRNGKIILQIDRQFGEFLDTLFNKNKEFWNCITLFHQFIVEKEIIEINSRDYITESPNYSETTVGGFPKSNLGIEYALRKQDDEDAISLDYLNSLLRTYKLDDKTIKGIQALING